MADFTSAKAFIPYEGRFLMVKHRYDGVDMFDLPGGRTEGEEDPRDAVVREGEEEIGLPLKVLGELGKYFAYNHEGKSVDCVVMHCKPAHYNFDTTKNPATTENIVGAEWVDPYRVDEYPMGNDLKSFLQKISWHRAFIDYQRLAK